MFRWKDSMYHALGYSSILVMQATMTFEQRDIQEAMATIKEALHTCQRWDATDATHCRSACVHVSHSVLKPSAGSGRGTGWWDLSPVWLANSLTSRKVGEVPSCLHHSTGGSDGCVSWSDGVLVLLLSVCRGDACRDLLCRVFAAEGHSDVCAGHYFCHIVFHWCLKKKVFSSTARLSASPSGRKHDKFYQRRYQDSNKLSDL